MPEDAADVVVVGYGPAGACAAIAAHDAGASVVIVEAAARGGGNAVYSGGFLFDVPEPHTVDHLDALCFGRTARPVLEAYAAGLHAIDRWLTSLGGSTVAFDPPQARLPAPFPSWPHLPAAHSIRYRVAAGGEGRRGEALWRLLETAVRDRGIAVRGQTVGRRLIVDRHGAVTGLVISSGGTETTLSARGGVLLTCGGFEADPALTDAYLPLGPAWPVGCPTNTGAGLRMAQAAGADLWHMYGFFGWFAFRTPQFAAPFAVDFFAPGYVFVDADGRRFADETGYEVHDRLRALLTYLPRNDNRPRLPAWAIFDEATRLAGPLNGLLGTPNDYAWSADNSAEVARGWIISADSPADLAARIGVDRVVLENTLAEYNSGAQVGHDQRFGRSADTLVPLGTGRLYAIETWPGVAGTTGGPRHDERARVVRPGGEPVPGLYAAGAVSLVWGHLIDHGGGLTDAIVFGRIAGAAAARRAATVGRAATAGDRVAGDRVAGDRAANDRVAGDRVAGDRAAKFSGKGTAHD
jgi:succinate dehydrogenase/fumarate reductase flavoprotein subunit